MKKLIFITLVLSLVSVNNGKAQEVFKQDKYGISIEKPAEWLEADNKQLLKNLEKFELDDQKLEKLIKDNNGSILLTSFYKYNPQTHAGLIPTIQLNVRLNPTRNFEEFKSSMVQSANSFKQYFSDFRFETEPKVIEVDGIKSIYFVGNFTMNTQSGEPMKVRSRTYAIPKDDYFFQLNFTDGTVKEDSSELFDNLVKTVKITK